MNKKVFKFIALGIVIMGMGSCMVYGPRHTFYNSHQHKPYNLDHHGHYPHPFGEHYNDNKNFSR